MTLRSGAEYATWTCPRKLIAAPEVGEYFRIWRHWQAGRYWYGNDLRSWRNKALVAMELIEAQLAEIEQEARENPQDRDPEIQRQLTRQRRK